MFPGYPSRQPPHTGGPAINRDLKPKRQKIKRVKNLPPLPQDSQPPSRYVPSPPASVPDLAQHLSELTLPKPNSGEAQLRKCETADAGSHNGPHTSSSVSNGVANQRHSLDLETHDFIKRSQHLERVPSRRHHHEWPQTKEDIDQHDFIPMEKPQTYCEEDWYVGACRRTDAEHALHLVNKDGAFLVRDCSTNTSSEPLVLVLYYEKKVFNVKIRYIESTYKYALGTGQRSNDMFDSVADIIKFHSIFPITLISGRNAPVSRYPENCVLTCPITRRDVDRLLQ